ncbi:MAG: hypothetical protein ACFFAO_01475 [Candidatus Hermodarchaeota archaeon]
MATRVQTNTEPELWGDVDIICPICRTKKKINIPMRIIDQSKQLTSILIPSGRICDHAIVPFIDKQLKVRSYQKLDALLDEFDPKSEKVIEKKPEDIDIIEVKMNIRPEMMMYAIGGSFSKKKILIVIDHDLEYLETTLFNFFDFIFHKSFNVNLLILTKGSYKKRKKFYEDYLVLYSKEIIGKNKKEFNATDLKLEEDLVKEFYTEGDSIVSIKNLKDRLRQIHALSFKLLEYYKKQGDNQPLQVRKAIRFLEDTHFIKIKKSFFSSLVEIVKTYFDANIILVQDMLTDKINQMWG